MMAILGICVILIIALGLSNNRRAINVRTVVIAFAIQFIFGAFVLYSAVGRRLLLALTETVSAIIGYSKDGIQFIFGAVGDQSLGFIFAFNVLPVIIFFSSLIAVLYHLRVMTVAINLIGGTLQKLLGTSKPESMSAAANIFVGQTEAPLVVRPFIPKLTESELFAIMVGGLASIAGSVMAGYAAIGIELKYLLAASFMAAPGGLLMAKIICPETSMPTHDTNTPEAIVDHTQQEQQVTEHVNVFDAAASGAASGLQLALNVGAMLLAFIGLIALLNGMIGYLGGWFGFPNLSLEQMLSVLFQPLAFVIGVPWQDSAIAGALIGQKFVINEFVAYLDFMSQKDQLGAHSQAVITFALCGFANLSSIAILMGGIGAMAPNRRSDIARLGLKAVIAASLANLLSACLASIFLSL